MLGNSLTAANNLPEIIADMLDAEVTSHTRGGARLAEHLNPSTSLGQKTLASLSREKWDYVIIQESSKGPVVSKNAFMRSASALCQMIWQNGAIPVLFETWGFGAERVSMTDALSAAYREASEVNRALLAEVGKRFLSENSESLFAEDGLHPSRDGSLLAAQEISRVIKEDAVQRGKIKPATSSDSRLRILLLYKLLEQHSDETHPLTTHDIMETMRRKHGITMHRTTIPGDIEILREAGADIHSEREKQQKYWMAGRKFSMAELRLLTDAVQSSRFITEVKSNELVNKLVSLTSEPKAEKLRRAIHVTGKAKTDNEKGYFITEIISEAIGNGKKLSFYYLDYDGRKKPVRRNNGKPYTVSPYDLIWDGDYYYMTGWCDERGEVRTFRVDRIDRHPRLLEEPAIPQPKSYRVEHYTQEVFRMFATQKTVKVILQCSNEVMRAIIDQFGKSVKTRPISDDEFIAEVTVCPGPTFFRWVFGWGGRIQVTGPEQIREEYRLMVCSEADRYSKNDGSEG